MRGKIDNVKKVVDRPNCRAHGFTKFRFTRYDNRRIRGILLKAIQIIFIQALF